jgi:hypothetical protein
MRALIMIAASLAEASATSFTSTRADDAGLRWYGTPTCSAASDYTAVVTARDVCQLVPGSTYPAYGAASYTITCNATRPAAAGWILFFSDTACTRPVSLAGVSRPFADTACMLNPPEFGSSSLSAQCLSPLPPAQPLAGRATVMLSSNSLCDGNAPRSLIDLRQGLCQAVPSSAPGGYRVTCAADGSFAAFDIYTDATCTEQLNHRILARDTCSLNDPVFGSSHIAIRCSTAGTAGVPVALNDPAASPTPSGAPPPGLA